MAERNRNRKNTNINPFIQKSKRVKIKQRGLNFRRRKQGGGIPNLHKKLLFIIEALLVVGLAFAVVFSFGIRIEMIGESMETTLSDGDYVLINRLGTRFFSPKSGSLVAFLPGGNEDVSPSIKRIIAVPHDRIRIENGAIYVNDMLYGDEAMSDYIEEAGLAGNEIKLGEDEYFCLGDNRNNSQDSRYESVGNIHKEDMLGTVWFLLGPGGFGFVQ